MEDQDLNETNKQQENLEGAEKAPSKFGAFVSIALAVVIFVHLLFIREELCLQEAKHQS